MVFDILTITFVIINFHKDCEDALNWVPHFQNLLSTMVKYCSITQRSISNRKFPKEMLKHLQSVTLGELGRKVGYRRTHFNSFFEVCNDRACFVHKLELLQIFSNLVRVVTSGSFLVCVLFCSGFFPQNVN